MAERRRVTVRLDELPYRAAQAKLDQERLTWQQLFHLLLNAWLVGDVEIDPRIDPRLIARHKSLEAAMEKARMGEQIVRRKDVRQW